MEKESPSTKTKKVGKGLLSLLHLDQKDRRPDRPRTYSDYNPPKIEPEEERKLVPERMTDGVVLYSSNFQIHIKGGVLDSIVKRLTHKSSLDSDISAFLLGYRSLLTFQDLVAKLFQLWHMEPTVVKDGLLPFEVKEIEEDLKITRIQVGKIIKTWISSHPNDFAGENAKLIEEYIQ